MTATRLNPEPSLDLVVMAASKEYTCAANGNVTIGVDFSPPSGYMLLSALPATVGGAGMVLRTVVQTTNTHCDAYMRNTGSSSVSATLTLQARYAKVV